MIVPKVKLEKQESTHQRATSVLKGEDLHVLISKHTLHYNCDGIELLIHSYVQNRFMLLLSNIKKEQK